MAMLCLLKRTADFSKDELAAWHAVLCGFQPSTINRACLMLAASQERFPELSDLLQQCRKIEPPEIPYNPHGDGKLKPLYESELTEIAARLNIEV